MEFDSLAGNEWVAMARDARRAGDFDAARMHYQRAAYGFAQMQPESVAALKREVAEFTAQDPAYQAALRLVRSVLEQNPGTLQSELGKQTGDNREMFNYVMYYGSENGDIVRVKSGRSYRLYLPGQEILPEPEKPKRLRKPKQ